MPVYSPSQHSRAWTVEQLRRLPEDGNRYEIIVGELFVTAAPSGLHQRAVLQLALAMTELLGNSSEFEIRVAPSDVIFSDQTLVQPDLLVIPRMEAEEARRRSDAGAPHIAVEVLSPATARTDRVRKRELYMREGVQEYWIVDLDARTIERWKPDDMRPEILEKSLAWQIEGTPPVELNIEGFFSKVWGS